MLLQGSARCVDFIFWISLGSFPSSLSSLFVSFVTMISENNLPIFPDISWGHALSPPVHYCTHRDVRVTFLPKVLPFPA